MRKCECKIFENMNVNCGNTNAKNVNSNFDANSSLLYLDKCKYNENYIHSIIINKVKFLYNGLNGIDRAFH